MNIGVEEGPWELTPKGVFGAQVGVLILSVGGTERF